MPLLVSMPNEYRLGGNHPNKEKRRERNEKESMYLSFHTEQRRREHRAGGGARRIKTRYVKLSEGEWGPGTTSHA